MAAMIGAPKYVPHVLEPLSSFYTIGRDNRYEIDLEHFDVSGVPLPYDCRTCAKVPGHYVFRHKKTIIPAMTRYIRMDIIFIPDDMNRYSVVSYPFLIELTDYERTYECGEFSKKRGLWYN